MDLVLDRKRVKWGDIKKTASLSADYLPREAVLQLTKSHRESKNQGKTR